MLKLKDEDKMNKILFLEEIKLMLEKKGFKIDKFDFERPWGGFFVIEESQTDEFVSEFFPELSKKSLEGYHKLSPKILVVAPQKRLSWQYHFRRAEIWRVIQNKIAVVTSETDEESAINEYEEGQTIVLKQGERHRLVGLEKFGVVAEIWQHTDSENQSDEDDIVRLQDDFGR